MGLTREDSGPRTYAKSAFPFCFHGRVVMQLLKYITCSPFCPISMKRCTKAVFIVVRLARDPDHLIHDRHRGETSLASLHPADFTCLLLYGWQLTTMVQSEPASPAKLRIPASLKRNFSQSSLRRKSAYLQDLITRQDHHKGYDREYKDALLSGEVGNGVRTWYSSFTTIGELFTASSVSVSSAPAGRLARTLQNVTP